MNNFISIKWDRFLAEGEADHFPWLEEIKSVDPEELRNWMNNSDRFLQVGRGSFRGVYVPLDDQDYVIKVVGEPDKYKMQMNKDDFETAKRYPFIFPKAYAHADDFSWIVMENTRPITWPSQMQKVLNQSFPKEQEALLKVADELGGRFNPADPFHIMGRIMDSFRAGREVAIDKVSDDPSDADRKALELQKIIAPVAGPAYQELSKAMHEFEIDKYEINRGNIGHDEDYNFKIIDSSVFSSDPDDDSWRIPEALQEVKGKKTNVFLDMDGTLVDFSSALKKHIKEVYKIDSRLVHPEGSSGQKILQQLQELVLSDEEIERLYNTQEIKFLAKGGGYTPAEKLIKDYVYKALANNKKLWLDMKKLKGANILVKNALALADKVFILSAPIDDVSVGAKETWVRGHFPQIDSINVHITDQKGAKLLDLISLGVVSRDDNNVLIDDSAKYIQDFQSAGGIGIRYEELPITAIEQLKAIIGD